MRSRLPGVDSATTIGVLTAAGVYLVYNNALPSIADIRTAHAHDDDVDTARKHAAYLSVAIIGGVFLISRDVNSYIISGAALVGLDLLYKHANTVNPGTGKADVLTMHDVVPDNVVHPLPDYADESA